MTSIRKTRRSFFKSVGAGTALSSGIRPAHASDSLTIVEKVREIPVVHTCDICVIDGGCTGVFAALRAARLGATVALVENNGYF